MSRHGLTIYALCLVCAGKLSVKNQVVELVLQRASLKGVDGSCYFSSANRLKTDVQMLSRASLKGGLAE